MHWYSGGNLEPAIRFTLKITAIRLISKLINSYGFSGRTANILGKNEFLYTVRQANPELWLKYSPNFNFDTT